MSRGSARRSVAQRQEEERGTDRRADLLEAAVTVIARNGIRGLRVAELAAEAGVSTALIYYHFADREGIVSAALDHINNRAATYTTPPPGLDPPAALKAALLAELQGAERVRTNSIAWGELRAAAVFLPSLQAALRNRTAEWNRDIEHLIRQVPGGGADEPAESACRLTALVEGVSQRWHSASITVDEARNLVDGAIDRELGLTRRDRAGAKEEK